SPSKLETGAIKVRVAAREKQVTFRFQNPISDNKDNLLDEPGGFGLANVQKRLQMLYPARHHLNISEADGLYNVELKINI
ncbi:MAG TPA: hypothetical protein VLA58_07430, partial [Chitinophagaceae bacterium]|nr:hypothetical protein [Chitinophagaceae bacterium]